MGICRLGDDGTFALFTDIDTWTIANPPTNPDWGLARSARRTRTTGAQELSTE